MFNRLVNYINRHRGRVVKRHLTVIAEMVRELHRHSSAVHLTIGNVVILEDMTVQVVYHEDLGEIVRVEILDEDYNVLETCGPRGITLRVTGGENKFKFPSENPIHLAVFDDIYMYIHALHASGWLSKVRTSELLDWCKTREYISFDDTRYNLGFLSDLHFRDGAFHYVHHREVRSIPVIGHVHCIKIDDLVIDLSYIVLIDDTSDVPFLFKTSPGASQALA